MASAARWSAIAKILGSRKAEGHRLMVVCSALSGVTNLLESLLGSLSDRAAREALLEQIEHRHRVLCTSLGLDADTILGESFRVLRAHVAQAIRDPGPATHAELIAMGERMSSKIGCAYLDACGLRASYMDARRLLRADHADGMERDARYYLAARCLYHPNPGLRAALEQVGTGDIVITQGFIARDGEGRTVLLGRGGSDTSAAYLSAILGASRLEIWTDVPGLFSANPRSIDDARLLPKVSYAEAQVFATLGAKVLHPRCLQPVSDHGIPVRIGWTERPDIVGTTIGEPKDEPGGARTVSSRKNLLLVSMVRDPSWQPVGFMAKVATCFSRHGLSMDLIASSPGNIRATIDQAACPHIEDVLPGLLEDLGGFCHPSVKRDIGCVSVAGRAVRMEAHRLSDVLARLAGPHVHMVCWAADDSHVSYVVESSVVSQLVSDFHKALFEVACNERAAELLGPSWRTLLTSGGVEGTVPGALAARDIEETVRVGVSEGGQP